MFGSLNQYRWFCGLAFQLRFGFDRGAAFRLGWGFSIKTAFSGLWFFNSQEWTAELLGS